MSFFDTVVKFTDNLVQKALGETYGPPQGELAKQTQIAADAMRGIRVPDEQGSLGTYTTFWGKANLYEPGTPAFEQEVDRIYGQVDQKERFRQDVGGGEGAKGYHEQVGVMRHTIKNELMKQANQRLGIKEGPLKRDRVETAAETARQVPDPVKAGILQSYSRNPSVLDALEESPGGVVVPWNQALEGEDRRYLRRAGDNARDAALNDYGKK